MGLAQLRSRRSTRAPMPRFGDGCCHIDLAARQAPKMSTSSREQRSFDFRGCRGKNGTRTRRERSMIEEPLS